MIAIVDYKAGNLRSVELAVQHFGADCTITRDPEFILSADRVIVPGDGAAESAMQHLNELGLVDPLREVLQRGTPLLGICIGCQMVLAHSEEDGGIDCLGFLPGNVVRFQAPEPLCKIPQMGWNTMTIRQPHPLLDGIEDDSEFYFIHSYYPAPSDPNDIYGETEYADAKFAAAIGHDNLFATQFHPERSGRIGMRLIENFTTWDGTVG